ncbi:MAG: hypothetical protein WDZ49_10265 [Litorilinea sp.]
MLRKTLIFTTLVALLGMSLNLSATFAGNAVYAQTATATPVAEEEPAEDAAGAGHDVGARQLLGL